MSLLDKLREDGDAMVAFFERELEHRKAQSYDVLKAPLRGMQLVPVDSTAGAGAETITYEQYEHTGVAKIVADYAMDLPRADVKGKEFTARIRSVANSFGYSLQEIRAAQFAGKPLQQRKANAAVRSQQEKWNRVLFYGDAEYGLQGWLTNPNIPKVAATEEAGDTAWFDGSGNPRKNAGQYLDDLNNLAESIVVSTNGAEIPTRVVMPIKHYSLIARLKADTGTDTTVLQYFLQNSPYIQDVQWANELSTAQLAANGLSGAGEGQFLANIMIAYNPSPEKLTFEMPVPFEQLPVQEKGLEFQVPCHSRIGGTLVYYPLSMAIMENV